MPNKQCNKCKKIYPITNFFKHKKGKYGVKAVCKKCYIILYKSIGYSNYKKQPWKLTFHRIRSRCKYNARKHYKRIKNFLTLKQVEFLWFRDRAYLMRKPSIDRINTYGDYKLSNCRYIEIVENWKRPKIKWAKE